tara:strand:- start:629 stop:1444 length:816 start_codon:yes stop_codon:yes gene_type:complete
MAIGVETAMVSKSALKGSDRLPGIFNSHSNKNIWTNAMMLFGAFVLLAFSAFVLTGNLAFAQEEGVSEKTVLDALMEAGFVGLLIILMSIVGGALAITFAFQLRRDVLVPPEVLGHVESLFEDEEYEEAYHLCEASPSILSAVVAAGLEKMDDGYGQMESTMIEVLEMESTKLHQKVGYLSLIANLSPMMGLLGTVLGMIGAFNTIASSTTAPNPKQLGGDISIALGTTFLGLCVAIPMTAVYVYFRNKVITVSAEVGGVSEELMGRFKAD